MARSPGIRLHTVCAALLLLAAQHTHADKCRTGCSGAQPLAVKLAEGTTYKYGLDGHIELALSSAEGSQNTRLVATALVTQLPDCVQVIRLQNVQLSGPDGKKQSVPGIDKPVTVSGGEVCSDAADIEASLNIKRAVASLLRPGAQEDVFGECGSDIALRKEQGVTVVTSSRDLTRCAQREHVRHGVVPSTVNLQGVAGTGPVFARYNSEHRVRNGILESATVTENYLYKPFSDGRANGATATVSTKITLQGQKKESVNVKANTPHPLHWSPAHVTPLTTSNIDSILSALKEASATPLSERSAPAFLQLVRVLRSSRKEDLLAVYGQVKSGAGGFADKAQARRLFFAALFRCGSGEAVEVGVQLLKSKELKGQEQILAYMSFGYTRHATKGSLTAATMLLDQAELPREAFLGIGSLAGRYCLSHPCPVDELSKLQLKLISRAPLQPASRQAEANAASALRALSTAGPLSPQAADKIAALIQGAKAPTRIRAGALRAVLRNAACNNKVQQAATAVLKNRAEDAELRIRAYRILVECPCEKVAQVLQELLNDEPVYQVGGYISSHLAMIRASVNPERAHAQQVLGRVTPARQYPIDPRKFSFATEMSSRWDSIGTAGVMEADVIYSPNSWLPRASSLNLTAEILGHNLNFLQIDVRQENLDRLIEHWLGPMGVLRYQVPPSEWMSSGKEGITKLVNLIRQRLDKTRGKRDVSRAEIEAFAKTVKIPGSEFNRDLDVDLNIRLFGSELMFLSLNEELSQITPEAIIDRVFNGLDSGLDAARNIKYTGEEHAMIADVEALYPTSLGLPLRWDLQGGLAARLQAEGGVDIRQILHDPSNAQLHAKIIPSANLEFQGGISVLTPNAASGIRISANVLTSTGVDLTVKLLEAKGVDVKLGLPVAKQQILRFAHRIDLANEETGKKEQITPLKFKDKPRLFSICFDQLTPLIGLEFCGELDSPTTLATNHVGFPLNGNIFLDLYIQKEDVNEYHLRALLEEPDSNSKALTLHFSTPGSKTDRTVELKLSASGKPKALRAVLQSPLKAIEGELSLVDDGNERAISARLRHDTLEYLAKIGVTISKDGSRTIYQPLVVLETPADRAKVKGGRKPDYTAEGQIIVDETGNNVKYTLKNIKLIAPGQPPILLSGTLGREGRQSYSADLQVSRDQVSGTAKGKLQLLPTQVKLNAEVTNSVNPAVNFNVKLDLKRTESEWDTSLVLIHGPDLSSKKHILTLAHSCKYHYTSSKDFAVDIKSKVSYPLVGLDAKAEMDLSPKHYEYDVTLKYDKLHLESELDAKVSQQTPGDYNIKLIGQLMSNKLQLRATRQIEGDVSKLHNALDVSGRRYSLDGSVTHHVEPNDLNVGANLVLKMHDRPDPISLESALRTSAQSVDASGKLSSGSQVLIELAVKGSRPSGSLHVSVPRMLSAEGSWTSADGQSNGNLLLNLPRIPRKLKLQVEATCKSPVHNLHVEMYFDHEKDNNNRLLVSSNNQLTRDSYNTKNKIDLAGQVLTYNSQGQITGQLPGGHITGQFELTLPNHDVVSGSIDRDLNIVDGVANGKAQAQFKLQRGNVVRTLEAKGVVTDTSATRGIMNVEWNIVASQQGGKDVRLDLVLRHGKEGEQRRSLYKATLGGSLLPTPLVTSIEGEYSRDHGHSSARVAYGPRGVRGRAEWDGRGLATPGQPASIDLTLDLDVQAEKCKTLQGRLQAKGVKPKQPDGVYEMEGSLSGTLNGDQTVQLSGNAKASIHNGEMAATITVPAHDTISANARYSRDKTEQGGKLHSEVQVKYAKDRDVKAGLTLNKINDEEYSLELSLDTPNEKARSINLQLHNKHSKKNRQMRNDITLVIDGQRYIYSEELVLSELNPSVEVIVQRPGAEKSRILARLNRLNPQQIQAELRLKHIYDLSLDAEATARIQSLDDFSLTANINSERLRLNHITFEASNKATKQANKIQFSAKSGDKNLFSGTTNYKTQSEAGKLIIEGSGTLSWQGAEPRSASFKYMQQQLQAPANPETGLEILLNAGVGSQGIVAELKLTDRQVRAFTSYCEEKKECAHIEVFSKLVTHASGELSHELEASLDLRKLGLSHEFGLKSTTQRRGWAFDHNMDLHFQSGERKYQYSIWAKPNDAGVQLTLPGRTLALEAKADSAKDNSIKAELALYLNKAAEPAKRTLLTYSANYQLQDKSNSGNTHTELRFATPGLARELGIAYSSAYSIPTRTASFSLDLDIFAKRNARLQISGSTKAEDAEGGYKVVSELSASSKALNLDMRGQEIILLTTSDLGYDLRMTYQRDKLKLEDALLGRINSKRGELLIKLVNHKLLHLDAAWQLSKNTQQIDTKICALGLEDMILHLEANNFNTIIATLARKASPQNKLRFSAALIPSQIADIRFEREKGGAKTDIAHASLHLDEANFLKPDVKLDSEYIQKQLVPDIQKESQASLGRLRTAAEETQTSLTTEGKQLNEILKKSSPNLKPAGEYYKQELGKIREEVVKDAALQELVEIVRKMFGTILSLLSTITTSLGSIWESLSDALSAAFTQLTDLLSKDILPQLKELSTRILQVAGELLQGVYDVVMIYVVRLMEIVKQHEAELRKIGTVLTELLQDINRLMVKFLSQLRGDLEELYKRLSEQIRALPIVEEIQERYKELISGLPVPEQLLQILIELCGTVKDLMPTDETKHLISVIQNLMERVYRKEEIPSSSLQQLSNALLAAINSLLRFVQNQQPVDYRQYLQQIVPLSLSRLSLPEFSIPQLSVLHLLQNSLSSLRNVNPLWGSSLMIIDHVPPFQHHGQIIRGQHIFTFDNRHLTFPGSCGYVLVQDAVNGNLSLVAELQNGALSALVFSDRHDTVRIASNGQVSRNGKAEELPIRTKDLEVFRLYETIQIVSRAGAHIIMEPNLHVVGVIISGFYHGQLRGLLGNANFEPHDDLLLPNGKLAGSEADLGNGYKLSAGCAAVSTPDHSKHGHDTASASCQELFSVGSPLQLCFPVIPREGFLQACSHDAEAERDIALAYVARCRVRGIPINVPERWIKCGKHGLGDSWSIRTPSKSADVVLLVEQAQNVEPLYKELLNPVAQQLAADLSAKGVADVKFSVVGYGGPYPDYPSHFTKGGQLSYGAPLPHLKFQDQAPRKPLDTGNKQVDEAGERLLHVLDEARYQLLLNSEADGVRETMHYPWRPDAARIVIWLRGSAPHRLSPLRLLGRYISEFSRRDGVYLSVAQPLELRNPPANAKTLVGVGERDALVLSDAKKRADNTELRNQLNWDLNHYVDYVLYRHTGHVFLTNNFQQAKGGQRKQFIQVMAHAISDDVLSQELGMDCSCERSTPFFSQPRCRVVSTQPRKAVKG